MAFPITFLLGAGASLPYGVPTMMGFYKEFHNHIGLRRAHCLPVMEKIEAFVGGGSIDLEVLMDGLEKILQMEDGAKIVGISADQIDQTVRLGKELRGYFDAFVVERCERFDRNRARADYGQLLSLSSVHPLWIFTTNYDRIIEYACAENKMEYDDGFAGEIGQPVFDWAKQFSSRVNIAKLHGSVNWYEEDPGGEIHRLDRGYSLPGHDFRLVRGSQTFKPLMIVPTLEKGVLHDPYMTLSVTFSDVLLITNLLIIVGHSLRDDHIRNIIKTRDNLNVLLVSPRASTLQNRLGDPSRTYALDAGFSEFIESTTATLSDLASVLGGSASQTSDSVGELVKSFVDKASHKIQELGAIEADPKIAANLDKLNHDRNSIRIAAVNELAKSPRPDVIMKLAAQLDSDPSAPVRVACVDALHAIGDSVSIGAIGRALTKDADRVVKQESVLALANLLPNAEATRYLEIARDKYDNDPAIKNILEDVLEV